MKAKSLEQVHEQWGSNISAARLDEGMTQMELALEAGVSIPAISFMERGQRMTVSNMVHVAHALQRTMEVLFPWPTNLSTIVKNENREEVSP